MKTDLTTTSILKYGWLCDYATGETIRPATEEELKASLKAARRDGGVGAFVSDDGQTVYVVGESTSNAEKF